jgi:hypothetical protein
VTIGLLDHSDLVFDTRSPDRVGALTELFLGDALGQRVIAHRLAKPLVAGLALDKDRAALSAGAFQGVEIPDFSFDGCDVAHVVPMWLNGRKFRPAQPWDGWAVESRRMSPIGDKTESGSAL